MRILLLPMFLPGLKRTGAEVVTQGFIDALRLAGHDVAVLGYRRAGTDPPRHRDDRVVADRPIETSAAPLRALGWLARAAATRRPYTQAKYMSRRYRRAVAELVGRQRPDLVVVDSARMAWLVPDGGWACPHVVVAHNVEYRIYEGLARGAGLARGIVLRREARVLRRAEAAACAAAAEVWALKDEDVATLEGLGARRVRTFAVPGTGAGDDAGTAPPSRDVAVLGGWHWAANAAGLAWFAERVVPRLGERGLEVHVAGADADAVVSGRPGLVLHGRVPDALEFLRSGRVVAVPSVTGEGVQIKTLDAIASGRPLVATSVAMRGIADPPGTVRVADDPAEFADAVAAAAATASDGADEARRWARRRLDAFRAAVAVAAEEVADGR